MDRRSKRKIRRDGSLRGARFVYSLILRAMARALNNNVPLEIAVPQYLSTIPPVEFETLVNNLKELDLSEPMMNNIKTEIEARYLLK